MFESTYLYHLPPTYVYVFVIAQQQKLKRLTQKSSLQSYHGDNLIEILTLFIA